MCTPLKAIALRERTLSSTFRVLFHRTNALLVFTRGSGGGGSRKKVLIKMSWFVLSLFILVNVIVTKESHEHAFFKKK